MAEDETNRRGRIESKSGLSLRLFFGLQLPQYVREAVSAHVEYLRSIFPASGANWVRPAGLHVTLKFLGEAEAIRLDALYQTALVAAAGVAPFKLVVEGAGTFRARGEARVLWLGVRDEDGQLARLQFRLDKECVYVGFPRETRPFEPHVTLARLRPRWRGDDLRELSETHRDTPFGPYAFQVTRFSLMRSELGPGAPRYTPIYHHALGG